ncbi:MAG: CBS and ACT domain-containing protein [Thermoleophilia bacterium]|nr:CBS and ACT domain-containing protein [Thermoleophilia bacterium]
MLVRTWMSTDPITIVPSASMKEAAQLMSQSEIRHLPVVEKDRLVGIVTLNDIRRASPSPATTFSVGEVNYLVDQIQVRDIMTPDPVTVSPETTVEDAALLGYRHRFGCLPVIEGGRLVGIITQQDLFDIIMSILQGGEGDRRITIEDMPPRLGTIRSIIDILDAHKTRFSSIITFPQRQSEHYTFLIRVAGNGTDAIVADLQEAGYPVTHVS